MWYKDSAKRCTVFFHLEVLPMTVTRVRIPLEQPEYSGLLGMSRAELRSPDDQLRHILRQELRRRGLLQSHRSQHQIEEEEIENES